MGMYREVRVETSLKKELESHFRCSRCGTEAVAVAVGWGSGEGISPYGIDDDGAGHEVEFRIRDPYRQQGLDDGSAPRP